MNPVWGNLRTDQGESRSSPLPVAFRSRMYFPVKEVSLQGVLAGKCTKKVSKDKVEERSPAWLSSSVLSHPS